jgi:signal transduction histidine kinase
MPTSPIIANTPYLTSDLPSSNNGSFIYTMVHEIRNPLTNINLATDVLQRMETDDSVKMYLEVIMRNTVRIRTMLTDLLVLAQINEMSLESLSVHSLLEDVLITNEDRIMLKKVVINKNFSIQDLRIKIKRSEVKIALTNIIINAIEAMPENDGLLEITTKLVHGNCVIIIKDNGCGISEENLDSIFKPYFTTKPGGLGLGLSNTKSLLHSNHIEIDLQSEPGKGTTFILTHKEILPA